MTDTNNGRDIDLKYLELQGQNKLLQARVERGKKRRNLAVVIGLAAATVFGTFTFFTGLNKGKEEAREELSQVYGGPKYDSKFHLTEAEWLSENGISPSEANRYVGLASINFIKDFIDMEDKGSSPALIREYTAFDWQRVRSSDILKLFEAGIFPSDIQEYNSNFDSWEILNIHNAGINARLANEYFEVGQRGLHSGAHYADDSRHIISLHKSGITPEVVREYNEIFSLGEVAEMGQIGVNSETANRFLELNKKYGADIDGFEIARYTREGISYKQVEVAAKQNWLERSVKE